MKNEITNDSGSWPDHWLSITVYNGIIRRTYPERQISIQEYERDSNSKKAIFFREWLAKDIEETRKLQEEKERARWK